MSRNVWHILWVLILGVVAQDPVANLPQGRIVGIKVFTENLQTPVEIFFGIPYATGPIGKYRFSAPERHTGWRRTFFAHRMPPKCPQIGDSQSDYISEDCLFLNIWTPRRGDGSSLPVVVILYSETWGKGGINLPCQELAAEGMVVVTVSYRLHLLSFFTLRSMAARGNLALLDQYLALLWVRDNIAAFGGDPTAITLMGHSAGADSVLYHMASPRSVGLFQRAIVMSPRNIWKTIDKELDSNKTETERVSLEVSRFLGCNSDREQEILHCMRSRPLADIMALYSKVNWSNVMQPIPDTFLQSGEQYLPMPLSVAFSTGKQPLPLDLLFGTNDIEVVNSNDIDYMELIKQGPSYISEYANNKVIPELLQTFSLEQPESQPLLQQAIHWEFWGRKSRSKGQEALHSVEALARMESSAEWGTGGALLAARLARRVSRLYVYRYSQPGVDLHGRQYNFTGAVHGADLITLMGDTMMLQVARRPATPDEKRFSSSFRKYITNFAKYGAPGPQEEWPPYKAGDAHVHDIYDRSSPDVPCATAGASFWLQYLPELVKLVSTSGRTEQLTLDKGENRLRGGVFAMVGVSIGLLMLLLACALLLHRERAHRAAMASDTHF